VIYWPKQRFAFNAFFTGLTKLLSQLTREGQWAKALEVYEALGYVGIAPDTTITNAAITACDKGGQWATPRAVYRSGRGGGHVLSMLGMTLGFGHL
jgi:hypothetical protein